jgi:hypothetical protein
MRASHTLSGTRPADSAPQKQAAAKSGKWSEHIADLVAHHEVGQVIEVGRLAIEDDQPRAVLFRSNREGCGRIDHER